ncbi:hypothetical protein KAW38_00500 [Candidatus Micrarchaeota archaeon]|nr:hypothetical protein [Candidatus Micrarchaeota archaeon]
MRVKFCLMAFMLFLGLVTAADIEFKWLPASPTIDGVYDSGAEESAQTQT